MTNLLTAEISKCTEWPNKLSKIQESLNTTIQSPTGFTPSRSLFGIERGAGNALHVESDLPNTQEKLDVTRDREITAERLLKNAEKQNSTFNKKRRTNVEFKQDDTMFVKPASTREAKLEKIICWTVRNLRSFRQRQI